MEPTTNDNPLRAGMRIEHAAPPCAIVIFGATGDLTKRKLLPALYRLSVERLLPAEFAVVGVAREQKSDEEFRTQMRAAVSEQEETEEVDEAVWQSFAPGLFYVPGDFSEPETFKRINEVLTRVEAERHTTGNRIYYLATAPDFFGLIAKQLGAAGMARPEGQAWTRIIVEKPFGHDLESARALNEELATVFEEPQVYRIDHYLGKETVQNLLVFRFANSIFEPVWNREYIDHVQITNAEAIGVEGRGAFYEKAGAVRDMIQSHVFQVMSLIAMEPPASLGADDIRDEKVKAMKAVREFAADRL